MLRALCLDEGVAPIHSSSGPSARRVTLRAAPTVLAISPAPQRPSPVTAVHPSPMRTRKPHAARPAALVAGPHLHDALAAIEAGEDPLRCELIAYRRLVPHARLVREGRDRRDVRGALIAAGVLRG